MLLGGTRNVLLGGIMKEVLGGTEEVLLGGTRNMLLRRWCLEAPRRQYVHTCNPAGESSVASQLAITLVRRSCCIMTSPARPMSIKTSIYPHMTT